MKIAIFFRREPARRADNRKLRAGAVDWTINDWADLPAYHPRRKDRD